MKKVAIYVLSLNYGGAEKAITNIANILSQNNEVTINSIYKLNNSSFYPLNSNVKVNYLTNYKPNREEFKNAIKCYNPFLILKEGIKALKILYFKRVSVIKFLKKENSDIIITTRKEHNYYLAKYAPKNIIKIGQEHNDFNNKKDINKVIKGAKELDYFMPSSEFLTKKYQKLLEGYKVNVKYIPLSINEHKSNNIKKENQIIAVGRLEKVKAFDDLIDVFKMVHQKKGDIKLAIVGTGSEEQNLKNKVKNENLKDFVIFKGKMNEDDLQKEYEKSKLLVITSHSESFGLIAIEAANAKTATIAFDSANGLKEILSENGILIKNRNKQEMANKIIEILETNEWQELGKKSKESIVKYYTKNVAKEWLDFINKI